MLFDPGITDLLRNTLPGLGDLFLLISQIGGELLYIGLLLIGFWAYNKKHAILATFVLITSVLSNYWLKYMIAIERPPSSNWYPGADAPNYSTPSGHAQNSVALYGWFTAKTKRLWIALTATILTLLIGISRIYLGVHFLGDILLGWVIGIIIVIVFYYLENPLREYLSRYRTEYLLVVLAIFGFLMTLVGSMLPPPPNDNFGAYGGFTIGLALGLILEMKFVNFSVEPHEGQRWRLVLRVVIGLILVVGLLLGLSPLLPTEEIWLRMLRYCIATIVGIFVWPFIFKKANL